MPRFCTWGWADAVAALMQVSTVKNKNVAGFIWLKKVVVALKYAPAQHREIGFDHLRSFVYHLHLFIDKVKTAVPYQETEYSKLRSMLRFSFRMVFLFS
jgi:hypothetical protein